MTIRLAINGFGRIGRNVLRALYTGHYREQLQVVAINDLGDAAVNAHLFQYDSVHGRFPGEVEHDAESLRVMGDRIAVSAIRNPAELPWKSLGVDIVLECTGLFTSRDKAAAHLQAGAGKVLISAPGKDVCTTNCLAPVAQVLHRELGIEHGLMTTIHAYTNDQNLSDVYHPDLYRARSATQSMIPTKTGAAEAVGQVLPELAGKLTGLAVRVPVINVSLVDLTVQVARDTSVDEVNRLLREASEGSPVLGYNTQPLVSVDFNHDPRSSIFDANHTKVSGRLVKAMAWYDNEWGFSNRMLDSALALAAARD